MKKNSTIDWEAQWAAHGLNYRDGFVHVELGEYVRDFNPGVQPSLLRLKPGPGFGDLSHPTTRLVLKMMHPHVQGAHVLDIGCGSGILALAAIAMGAKSVAAIDIDEEALEHARRNSALNGMGQRIEFVAPENFRLSGNNTNIVVLMNMIQLEQIQAWNSLSQIHSLVGKALTSGILSEGRDAYLELCHSRQWHCVQEAEESGWLGFIFTGPKVVV